MARVAWAGVVLLFVGSLAHAEIPGTPAISVSLGYFVNGVPRNAATECLLTVVGDRGVIRAVATEGATARFPRTEDPAYVILECGPVRIIEPAQQNLLYLGGVVLLSIWTELPQFEAEQESPGASERDFVSMMYRNGLLSAHDHWRKLPKATQQQVRSMHLYSQVVGSREGKQLSATRTWVE